MARGDLTIFEEFVREEGEGVHDFSSDTLKLGIIDNSTAPTAADATPRWGDYSGDEVSTAGNYTADGETVGSVTWVEADGVATLDGANVTVAQDASGFTDGYYAILYNDTATNDEAICFVDLGGPASEVAGDVNVNWHASGIYQKTLS